MEAVSTDVHGMSDFSMFAVANLNFVVQRAVRCFFHPPRDVSSTPVLDIWGSGRQKGR
jgi:hypothetical protein